MIERNIILVTQMSPENTAIHHIISILEIQHDMNRIISRRLHDLPQMIELINTRTIRSKSTLERSEQLMQRPQIRQ